MEDVFHESAKPTMIEEVFYFFLDDSEKQEKTHYWNPDFLPGLGLLRTYFWLALSVDEGVEFT